MNRPAQLGIVAGRRDIRDGVRSCHQIPALAFGVVITMDKMQGVGAVLALAVLLLLHGPPPCAAAPPPCSEC